MHKNLKKLNKSMKIQLKTNRTRILTVVCEAALAICFSQAISANAASIGSLPDMSALSSFTTFGNFCNDNLVTINGNVGVSANGTWLAPNAQINGSVYLGGGVSTSIGAPTHVSGTINYNQNLAAAQSQVFAASSTLAGLAADYSVGNLTSAQTFNAAGSGGVTVINMNSISLGSGNIVLNGGAGEYFVINVSGAAAFTGSAGIVGVGGVDAAHILINLYNSSLGNLGTVAHIDDVLNGTILVPYDSATFHSENGAIYSGNGEVTLMSGATVTSSPFSPPSVPDAGSSAALLGVALLAVGSVNRRFRRT